MQPDVDVSFRAVWKRYLVRQRGNTTSDGSAGENSQRRAKPGRDRSQREFWAVNNVSFELEHGEALGIIGHNGAGKSTVLKLLSGITAPTRGEISIRGRLSALLEVGSGFHPELTGRENVYLSGSVLGMPREQIHRKLDSIIEFAGVQRFIDMPVKRYSSGMYVRLGFSIAAHLEPDVLLLDEVLAVGDREFRDRCKERIHELHAKGTTIVFISHDLASVQSFCNRVLLLEHGRIAAEGSAEQVIHRYTQTANLRHPSAEQSSRAIRIADVAFFDKSGERCAGFQTGKPIHARVEFVATEEIPNAMISLVFHWPQGWPASSWTTLRDGKGLHIRPGKRTVEFSCEQLGLQSGAYSVDAHIQEADTRNELEHQPGCTSIHVKTGERVRGSFYIPHSWRQIS